MQRFSVEKAGTSALLSNTEGKRDSTKFLGITWHDLKEGVEGKEVELNGFRYELAVAGFQSSDQNDHVSGAKRHLEAELEESIYFLAGRGIMKTAPTKELLKTAPPMEMVGPYTQEQLDDAKINLEVQKVTDGNGHYRDLLVAKVKSGNRTRTIFPVTNKVGWWHSTSLSNRSGAAEYFVVKSKELGRALPTYEEYHIQLHMDNRGRLH